MTINKGLYPFNFVTGCSISDVAGVLDTMLAILYYFIIVIVIIIDFIGVSGFDPFYYGLLFFNFFNSVF